MNQKEDADRRVLIAEKEDGVRDRLEKVFQDRGYSPVSMALGQQALTLLEKDPFPLMVLGDTEDQESPFHLLRAVVMKAPMTSTLLLSDLPSKTVEEQAEGYGILGHIPRTVPSKELGGLLHQYETIRGALRIQAPGQTTL